MKQFLFATLIAASMILPAVAGETPPLLPTTAKKLSGADITALYDGATVNWHRFKVGGTGTTTYDFKTKTISGTWAMGGKKGTFTGKIRVKEDKFCYTINPANKNKEICGSVYTDGTNIYEVTAKGVVDAQNQKQ